MGFDKGNLFWLSIEADIPKLKGFIT